MPAGACERRAVPPVLFVEVLRHLVEQIVAEVEIRKYAVFLEGLQDGRRHSTDRMPAGVLVARQGQRRAVRGEIVGGSELPAFGQLDCLRGRMRARNIRKVCRTKQ